MEKVRPWCGQPSDRGRLKIRSDSRKTFAAAMLKSFRRLWWESAASRQNRERECAEIVINNGMIFFLNCVRHFGNFKPTQFPSAVR